MKLGNSREAPILLLHCGFQQVYIGSRIDYEDRTLEKQLLRQLLQLEFGLQPRL